MRQTPATSRAKIGLLALALLFPFALSVVRGAPGIVKTRDGQTIEGEINENSSSDKPNEVTITSHGVRTVVNRADVLSIDYTGSIRDQYLQRLAAIPKGQDSKTAGQAHLTLARWL